jgi:hypothetical protein
MGMLDLANLNVTLRPIQIWPGPFTHHDSRLAPFKAGLSSTARLLARELGALGAKKPVLEMAISERDIRNDGLPRTDARPTHPGVILSFECRYGHLRPYTDSCRTWQDNLRAIAMHMENLRHASLYGVGKAGQQYSGWKQLPQSPSADADMTPGEAAVLLARYSGHANDIVAASAEAAAAAFRIAAMKTHPDRNGGSDGDFKRVTAARDVLHKHHGGGH